MSNQLKRAASAAIPSELAKRVKTAHGTPSTIDHISSLPIELLQQILILLHPGDYIAIKFDSRALNAAAFTSSGKDIRGWKGTNNDQLLHTDPHLAYHGGVLAEEATRSTPLLLLTCWNCGQRKGHNIDGFSDDQFDQKLLSRKCIECKYPRWYTSNWYAIPPILIHKVAVERCHKCTEFYLLPKMSGRWERGGGVHRCPHMMTFEEPMNVVNKEWTYMVEADVWVEAVEEEWLAEASMVEESVTEGWMDGVGVLFYVLRTEGRRAKRWMSMARSTE